MKQLWIIFITSIVWIVYFSGDSFAQRYNWPPPTPDNSGWSSVFASLSGPIPLGAQKSYMTPNGDVYIAGRVGTGVVVARWDRSTQDWELLGERLRRVGATFITIYSLVVHSNGDVYISGTFDRADNGNGTPPVICNQIARWNASANPAAWEAVGQGTSGAATTIALDEINNRLYIGSVPTGFNPDGSSVLLNGIGYWDIINSVWQPVEQGVNSSIYDILVDPLNNDLYICGVFDQVFSGSGTDTVNHIARWDGSSWSTLGQGFFSINSNSYPTAMVWDSNDNLIVAGRFDSAINSNGSAVAGPVVSWDGSNWQSLGHAGVFTLDHLQIDNLDNLYTMYFDNNFTSHISKYDGSQWTIIGEPSGEIIFTISSHPDYTGNTLYAGGLIGGILYPPSGTLYPGVNNLLFYSTGVFWREMRGSSGANGRIYDIYFNGHHLSGTLGNTIYVGGRFSQIANINVKNIAKYDGRIWSEIGKGVSGTVHEIYQDANLLLVGGEFAYGYNVNGDSVRLNNIGIYNLAWNQWEPLGNGVDGPVYAIASDVSWLSSGRIGNIYIGGNFTAAFQSNGDTLRAGSLATFRFNFSSTPVWENFRNVLGVTGNAAEVRAFASKSFFFGDMVIAGSFTGGYLADSTFVPSNNIIKWDGSGPGNLLTAGQGVDSMVFAIKYVDPKTLSGDPRVWVGGKFQNAINLNGSIVNSPNIAIYWDGFDVWSNVAAGTNGPVYDISPVKTAHYKGVFLGGDFTLGMYPNGNGRGMNNFGVFSLEGKPGVLPNWNARGDGVNDAVYAVESYIPCFGGGEYAFVGGDFNIAGNGISRGLAKWKWLWHSYYTGIVVVGGARSSGSGGSSGRSVRAVMALPACFPINKSPKTETILFDSLGYGDSFKLDSMAVYRPFDLTLLNADDPLDTLAVFDSLLLDSSVPLSLVFAGIVDDTSLYSSNPDGRSIAPRIIKVELHGDSSQVSDVQILFVHAVTDAPTIDITIQGGSIIAQDLAFGDISQTINLTPGLYTFNVVQNSNGQLLHSFTSDLSSAAGEIKTIVASGFLDSTANQNGPSLGFQLLDTGAPILNNIKDNITENSNLPYKFQLNQNYPNPFNPTTTISFTLPNAGQVQLAIYDILGQKVRSLLNSNLSAGIHNFVWDGNNDYGTNVAGGIYFYRLSTTEQNSIRKMILLK